MPVWSSSSDHAATYQQFFRNIGPPTLCRRCADRERFVKPSPKFAREHTDANVVAFGQRLIGPETAREALKVFLATEFGGGRHVRRVAKLSKG